MTLSVLVVCLGNICRSPMGEAVLKHVASERGIDIAVESAGTSNYHIGEEPDERTVATCRQHKVPIDHTAQQVSVQDFNRFTHILASDESNLRSLEHLKPKGSIAEVRLWGAYLDSKPIPDPYYGGVEGFEHCYQQVLKLSNAFLDAVANKAPVSAL